MTERRPQPGELYMHFKKKMYQILTIAKHSETGEELVIYQALYGDYLVYARPLAMFISEVDHVKYPEVTQQYRFEKVERNNLEPSKTAPASQQKVRQEEQKQQTQSKEQYEPLKESLKNKKERQDELQEADPRLLCFLDADTYKEKYEVLVEMEKEMTDRLINDFAVILDVVIPEGELSYRYEQLKQSIATMAKYENSRLR